nr:hypothetical protein [Actinomadura madurae]
MAAPAIGSIQCQDVPATTASKSRPAASQVSKAATSTSRPRRRAKAAMRASGSTPSTVQPGGLELPGGGAGAAADVQDVRAGARGGDPVHHGVGIGGTGPVVACGVRAEGLGDVPGTMGFGRGAVRLPGR